MTALTRDQILEASDIKTEVVKVPEWGGEVTVREFSAGDRDRYEQGLTRLNADGKRETDLTNMRAKIVALVVTDGAGNPMFTEADVGRLSTKSAGAIERIVAAATRMNKLGEAAVVEEAKNSETAPSSGSSIDLPAISE